MSDGSTSLTSFTLTDAVLNTLAQNVFGRSVTICITQAGSLAGYSWNDRIVSDDGAGNIVLLNGCPFGA